MPLYNISSCQSMLKYLSLYGKLCIFTHHLPICYTGAFTVVCYGIFQHAYLCIYSPVTAQKTTITFNIYLQQCSPLMIQSSRYNMSLSINPSCCGSHIIFYLGFLQSNYRKMTMEWSFSYNSFVKLSLYNIITIEHCPS